MAETADEAAFPPVQEWRRDQYLVSTDKRRIDLAVVHDFLTNHSYWAAGVPLETVRRSLEHSLVFGVYAGEQQVGMARVITDYATYAYIADVFILDAFRGLGLGVWLMECVAEHPNLQGQRRWTLFTRDAHSLYEKIGFKPSAYPERLMERLNNDIYKRKA